MPIIRYESKAAASEMSRAWGDAAATFGLVGAAFGAIGVVPGAATCGIIAALANVLGRDADHIANDPPRLDFHFKTHVVMPRKRQIGDLTVAPELRPEDEFNDSARLCAAYLEAFTRALERSQGAEVVGAWELSKQHRADCEAFAPLTAETLLSLAHSTRHLEFNLRKTDWFEELAQSAVERFLLTTESARGPDESETSEGHFGTDTRPERLAELLRLVRDQTAPTLLEILHRCGDASYDMALEMDSPLEPSVAG